jgi:hypothetical protein
MRNDGARRPAFARDQAKGTRGIRYARIVGNVPLHHVEARPQAAIADEVEDILRRAEVLAGRHRLSILGDEGSDALVVVRVRWLLEPAQAEAAQRARIVVDHFGGDAAATFDLNRAQAAITRGKQRVALCG